jgi:transposase
VEDTPLLPWIPSCAIGITGGNGVRTASLWAGLLGIEGATVKAVELDPEGRLTVTVRLRGRQRRCGVCHRRCSRYDQGDGVRRWRVLDLDAIPAYLEAAAPRVRCRQHGVVVAAVPWARHGSRFSRTFEDQVAWLVTRCDLTAVAELIRIAWRSVGAVIARVTADAERGRDRLAGQRRIGIDSARRSTDCVARTTALIAVSGTSEVVSLAHRRRRPPSPPSGTDAGISPSDAFGVATTSRSLGPLHHEKRITSASASPRTVQMA